MGQLHRMPACIVLLFANLAAGSAAGVTLNLDLLDGTHFHDEPTFVHPVDPPRSPNGEIEDNYFSPTLSFSPRTLNPDVPESNELVLDVRFRNRVSGAQQFLVIDAAGTGAPFPETFAIRFPGPPTHDTIGPGMFFSGGGTVGGIADGTVTTQLNEVIGDLEINDYSVPMRCFIDNCTTEAHFRRGHDLTDSAFLFGGLSLRVTLTDFDSCSLSRPDCTGITISGFGFGMLAGDISILEQASPAPAPVPLPSGMVLLGGGLLGLLALKRRRSDRW